MRTTIIALLAIAVFSLAVADLMGFHFSIFTGTISWGPPQTDIRRMTGFQVQVCSRPMAFSRAGPRPECQDGPTAGEIGAPRLGSAEIAFIKAHLAQGSCWNQWQPDAHHAGAGSGGSRSSAINRKISVNSILGTATSAIWNAT